MDLRRPGTVTAAGMIAVASSLICLLVFGVLTVAFLLLRGDLVTGLRDADDDVPSSIDPETAANIATAVVAVFALWCLGAIVSAMLALGRSRAGRWLLTVSAIVSSVFSLIGTFAVGLPVLLLVAAVTVVVLLFTPAANAWYAARGAPADEELPLGTTQPWG